MFSPYFSCRSYTEADLPSTVIPKEKYYSPKKQNLDGAPHSLP